MKKRLLSIGCIVLITLSLAGISAGAQNHGTDKMSEWGHVLQAPEEGEVYAQGKRVQISVKELEQTTAFYQLTGMSEEEAKKEAEKYTKQYEALYAEALSQGYTVTEAEVQEYVEQLKKMAGEIENKEEIQAIIDTFPSEEDYWTYEIEVYKKQLPIQNFVSDLEKDYLTEHGAEGSWDSYFEEYQRELAEKEKYTILADSAAFKEYLKSIYKVVTCEKATHNILTGECSVISADGKDIQVYAYPSQEKAEEDGACLGSGGYEYTTNNREENSKSTTSIDWVSQPHFYMKDSLIVVYVGADDACMDNLTAYLGEELF